MNSNSSLKIVLITVACILIAVLSFFFLAGILSSPETYAGIIRSIDEGKWISCSASFSDRRPYCSRRS